MNILITGANGFIGQNLVAQLKNIKFGKAKNYKLSSNIKIFEYNSAKSLEELDDYCKKTDFVFNLAGVNRPKEQSEFMTGNFGFASTLLNTLKKYKNTCPVMLSSSTQATLNNPYGESKRASENLFFDYAKETGAKVLVYRFPNIFGKWCRPNYNSAVATFCHNIACDLPIQVNNRETGMNLVYIDDVINELIAALKGEEHYEDKFCIIPTVHSVKLGEIVDLLYSFKENKINLDVSNFKDEFAKKLYSTFLSYLH